jgi:hypothetical protein
VRTATIGRQAFVPDPASLRLVFSALALDLDPDEFLAANPFGEAFFSLLGAEEVVSLDYSSYEGATVLHDMNLPVPAELRERFSVVHDGGTIEHVFDIAQALKNCMEMVEVGGHFTQVNVANNLMGHGFWQFSPELVFRAFSVANGYQIEAVLMHELVPGGGWYLVADPDELHARVQLCNDRPTYILTVAKRVARTEIFATPPQQSDYVAAWNALTDPPAEPVVDAHAGTRGASAARRVLDLRRHVPTAVKEPIKRIVGRPAPQSSGTGFDQPCYRPISEADVLSGRFRRP